MLTGDQSRMPTRALARLAGLLLALALTASVAQAQPRTVIAVDPADEAAAFGAADLRDAIARWRAPVTVVVPARVADEAAPNVVVVTTETARLPIDRAGRRRDRSTPGHPRIPQALRQ